MFSTFRKFFSVQLVFHHPKYENSHTFCQKRGFVYFFHLQCPNMSPISSKINDYGIQNLAFGIQFLAFRLDMLIFPSPSSGSISHQVMEVELRRAKIRHNKEHTNTKASERTHNGQKSCRGYIDTKLDIIIPLRASQGKLGHIVLQGISLQLTLHISKGRGAAFWDDMQVKINRSKDHSKISGCCSKFNTNL